MTDNTNKQNKLEKQEEAELEHFMKLLDDLSKIDAMNDTINTALFLKNEKKDIEKHILNAKIRTSRNLYWSGKLLGMEYLVDDIPEYIKKQEAQLKKMKKKKNED